MAINKNKVIASAQRFAQKGQLDRAIKEYRSIVEEDPEDIRIWLKIGDLYYKKGSIRDAVGTYTRVATHYSDKGFFLKAVAVYKQVLNIDPTYIEAHLKLAELYVQLGLAPDAIGQYQIVVGAYERDGRHKDSLELLRRIVELAPDDLSGRIRLAEAHIRQAENDAAADEYRFVLNLLYQTNRADEFVQVAERLLFLAPSDLDTIRTLADVHLRRGDAKRALARLQTLFKADPTNLDTLSLLARAFTELGQHVKAVSVYRELARLYGEVGDENGRLEAYRRIIALDPYDNEAIQILGTQHRQPSGIEATRGGDPTSAITSTQGMTRLGAVVSPVEEALTPAQQIQQCIDDADLYMKYGLGDHALGRINEVFQIQPEHTGALLKLKEIALAIGRPGDALTALVRLARATGDSEPDQAMAWLGEALQMQPDHPEATRLMERLSRGMAANLTQPPLPPRSIAPAPIEPAPMDDGGDFDADFDLDAIDLDDEVAPPKPARAASPRAAAEDDFSDLLGGDEGVPSDSEFDDLLGADGDDFADLLGADAPPPPPRRTTREADDFADLLGGSDERQAELDGFDDLLADGPSSAAALREDDGLGDLLNGPIEAASSVEIAGDGFDDLLGEAGATGVTGGDDFGDLLGGPIQAAESVEIAGGEFDDLLGEMGAMRIGDAGQIASPSPEAPSADDDAFGDLLAGEPDAEADDFGDLLGEPARRPFGRSGPGTDTAIARLDSNDDFAGLFDDGAPEESADVPLAVADDLVDDAALASIEGADDDFADLLGGSGPPSIAPLAAPADAAPLDELDDLFGADAVEAPARGDAPDAGIASAALDDAGSAEPEIEGFDDLLAADAPESAEPDPFDDLLAADAPESAEPDPFDDLLAADAPEAAEPDPFDDLLAADAPEAAEPDPFDDLLAADAPAVAVPDAFDDLLAEAHASPAPAVPAAAEADGADPIADDAPEDDDLDAFADLLAPEVARPAAAEEEPLDDEPADFDDAADPFAGLVRAPAAEGRARGADVNLDFGDLNDPLADALGAPAGIEADIGIAADGGDDDGDATIMADADAALAAFRRPPPPASDLDDFFMGSDEGEGLEAEPSQEIELEAELASLPGVDLGLGAPDASELDDGEFDEIELIDDEEIEVLDENDDSPELMSRFDVEAEASSALDALGEDAARDGTAEISFDLDLGDEAAKAPSAMLLPPRVAVPEPADVSGELAELDFLLDSNLVSDAGELLEELELEYPGHPELDARRARLDALMRSAMPDNDDFDPASVQGATITDLTDEDVHAHFDLGLAFKEMGRYDKAIEQLEKAARNAESRPEALRVMALCDLALGNAPRAVDRLREALELPNVGRDARMGLHYDLATAFEAVGDRSSASQHLRQIAEAGGPDFLDTRDRLRRLGASAS